MLDLLPTLSERADSAGDEFVRGLSLGGRHHENRTSFRCDVCPLYGWCGIRHCAYETAGTEQVQEINLPMTLRELQRRFVDSLMLLSWRGQGALERAMSALKPI